MSHFIQPNNALDQVASRRATTVYLVEKAVPMLPRILSENLCSLNPNVEKLAFSVVWKVDSDGNEIGPRWFGKSVIKTCVRLSYGEAQTIIETEQWPEAATLQVAAPHTNKTMTEHLIALYVSMIFKVLAQL